MKAVDDNKTNLTYFVRVDWHLPERELTKKTEANLGVERLKTCSVLRCSFGKVEDQKRFSNILPSFGGITFSFSPQLAEKCLKWMQPFIGYWGYLSSQPIGLQDDPDTAIEQGHKAIAKAKQANFGEGATVCSVTC